MSPKHDVGKGGDENGGEHDAESERNVRRHGTEPAVDAPTTRSDEEADDDWPLARDPGDATGERGADLVGTGASVETDPNEVGMRLPVPGRGRSYVRVRTGDRLLEGDRAPFSSAVEQWEVTAITPDLVSGRRQLTGKPVVWDRAWIETQLATGGMSTNLTDFVRVALRPAEREREHADDPTPIRVVAYGDDGRRHERLYRPGAHPPDPAARRLGLWWVDEPTDRLPAERRRRLDRRVGETLAEVGFEVEEAIEEDGSD